MGKCLEQINYSAQQPREFPIRSNRFQDWERTLKDNLNPSVRCVVLLLPGAKGKAPLYDDLKKLLLKDIPVPSQVVLANTISRGKNVRSICSKILIQMCAKIGGEPWAIEKLPYFDLPSMVCGLDIY
jgi:aubergine